METTYGVLFLFIFFYFVYKSHERNILKLQNKMKNSYYDFITIEKDKQHWNRKLS